MSFYQSYTKDAGHPWYWMLQLITLDAVNATSRRGEEFARRLMPCDALYCRGLPCDARCCEVRCEPHPKGEHPEDVPGPPLEPLVCRLVGVRRLPSDESGCDPVNTRCRVAAHPLPFP